MSSNHQTELNIEVKNIHPFFFKLLPKLNIYSCIVKVEVKNKYKLYIHALNRVEQSDAWARAEL